jgi:putative Mg2+ transporter-C (MgtC) family protein
LTFTEIYDFLTALNPCSIAFRILLSALLGGVVGWERGHHGRAAGLRTHILVCLGAAVSTLVGLYTALELGFNNDPLRVGAQVVSGIGFLGVGTIMIRNREHVTGLTTAAGLWVTACIGLAVGVGFYLTAILAFLVVITAFSILGHIEFGKKPSDVRICYVEFNSTDGLQGFYETVKALVLGVEIIPAKSGLQNHVGMEIRVNGEQNYAALNATLSTTANVLIALPQSTT